MSQEQLSAFVQRAQSDAELLQALSQASDVEAVATIARGAGFTVSAADLWAESDLQPEMLLEALLGIRGGITKLRGQWFHLEASQGPDQPSPNQAAQGKRAQSPRSPLRWPEQGEGGIALMPLLHPSYLLRNPSETEGSPRWLTRADLVAVRQRLGE